MCVSHFVGAEVIRALRVWPIRAWVVACASLVVTLIASGVPTGIIPSNLYHRMTPVLWWNYPIWTVSGLLLGLLAGSYFSGMPAPKKDKSNRGIWGELVSFIAVGCPICNKVVVALLGVTGAMDYFAPIQPILGIAGVALLAWALYMRLRGQNSCSLSLASNAGYES